MLKKVKREELTKLVNEVAPKVPETIVFIAGARAIKNGQTEIEFVQSRALSGRKTSMLALLNAGDDRFSTGRTTMRVWQMVNAEGFANVFGTDIDIKAIIEATKSADKDERIAIMAHVETINVNGIAQPVSIVCKETVDIEQLPKSIRTQLQDPDLSEDIKNRYILQTKDGELISDAFGNKIYRHFELTYGEVEDVLVPNKALQSDVAKKATKSVLGDKAVFQDVLSKVGNGLAEE